MSWDWLGLGLGTQYPDHFYGGIHNQMANAYNQQYACFANGNTQSIQDLLSARPGGVIRVSSPSSVQLFPRPKPAGDCEGCGAPLKAYIHHCEYCRRPI